MIEGKGKGVATILPIAKGKEKKKGGGRLSCSLHFGKGESDPSSEVRACSQHRRKRKKRTRLVFLWPDGPKEKGEKGEKGGES